MPWGAVAGAAVSTIGGALLSDDKNGGAGTTSKAPWSEAEPWLIRQLEQGQTLQDQYAARPFNARQTAGYNNQYALSDYQRQLVPSLLEQLGASPVGFDPANPQNRPKAFSWATQPGGSGRPDLGQTGLLGAQEPAAPPAAAPVPEVRGPYEAFDPTKMDLANYARATVGMRSGKNGADLGYNGGLGSFKYGEAMPQFGTQKYLDYQQFLQAGGDPLGLYSGTGSSGGL